MEKIRKYVERFFKGKRCNPRYEIKYFGDGGYYE